MLLLAVTAFAGIVSDLPDVNVQTAVARLIADSAVNGSVEFTQNADTVTVAYNFTGLLADYNYSLWIREYGDALGVEGTGLGSRVFFVADNITSTGTIDVATISLNGNNTVIGRSIELAATNSTDFADADPAPQDEIAGFGVITITATAAGEGEPSCEKLSASAVFDDIGLVYFSTEGFNLAIHVFATELNDSESYYLALYTYGDPQNIGSLLASFGDLPFFSENGTISGFLRTQDWALNGNTSVVGRGAALIRQSDNAMVAFAPIGATLFNSTNLDPTVLGFASPVIYRGVTVVTEFDSENFDIDGWIIYELVDGVNGIWKVSHWIGGLNPETFHPWHVHRLGDIATTGSVDGHFIGNPEEPRIEIGTFDDGDLETDDLGISRNTFFDDQITFNGENSINGRSIIVHDSEVRATRIAVGAIGRRSEFEFFGADEASVEDPEAPIQQAICMLETTRLGVAPEASGFVYFQQEEDSVHVRFYIAGLTQGAEYPWHIHKYGDVIDQDRAQAVGGHLIGMPEDRDEVGQIDDNQPVTARSDSFDDDEFDIRQILGRGIIIHDSATNARIGQCVIGLLREGEAPDYQLGPNDEQVAPHVVHAQAIIRSADESVNGIVTFMKDSSSDAQFNDDQGVVVRYFIEGLPPNQPSNWHVHVFGDLFDNSELVAGHFVGEGAVRPEDVPQQVGEIYDGEPLFADENGVAYGVFLDTQIELVGPNSVVGRAMIVHDGQTPIMVGHGVIGRVEEQFDVLVEDSAFTSRAGCSLTTTVGSVPVNGWVVFEQQTADDDVITYFHVAGFEPGEHRWHVHSYGDVINVDGFGVGGHFIGDNPVRPAGVAQEVGSLDDDLPIIIDSNGFGYDYFSDDQIKLNGINSIVGRGMIIHSLDGGRQAQCVIGRIADTNYDPNTRERFEINAATCELEATDNNLDQDLTGTIDFIQTDAGLRVDYEIEGLSDGEHGYHVHDRGMIIGTDGLSVGGHYIGSNVVRAGDVLDEVGYLDDGRELVSANGETSGSIVDVFATLNGPNSIVGRAMIIHGNAEDPNIRVAQCVIGIDEPIATDGETVDDYPVGRAFARLDGEGVSGMAEFGTFTGEFDLMVQDFVTVRISAGGLFPNYDFMVGIYQDDELLEQGELMTVTSDENGFIRDAQMAPMNGMQLFGMDSIVGREMRIVLNGEVVASGVVGITQYAQGEAEAINANGLGGGAIAGIVIAVTAGIGAAGFAVMKKKDAQKSTEYQAMKDKKVQLMSGEKTLGSGEKLLGSGGHKTLPRNGIEIDEEAPAAAEAEAQ